MIRRACALLVAVGCGTPAPLLEPVIDVPPADSFAYPYAGVDEFLLSVARLGDDAPLQETLIQSGDPFELSDIPFGEQLIVQLSGRAGLMEVAYGRTCPFTLDAETGPPADGPHLFFARNGTWAPSLVPAETRRTGGHGYALPDGQAVFIGGGLAVSSVDRFDPYVASFTAIEALTEPRLGSVLTSFADGRALIVGGTADGGDPTELVEVIDPRPTTAPSLQRQAHTGPRVQGHAAATLVDDDVVVAGGCVEEDAQLPCAVSAQAWRFGFGAGNALEPAREIAAMNAPRAGHTMTRLSNELDSDVLVVGGRDGDGQALASAELYRPLRESFEPLASAALSVPRWGHAAIRLRGGFVLIAGGFTPDPGGGDPVPVSDLELYDPLQGTFEPVGALPDGAGLTGFTVTEFPDGSAMLAGGLDASGSPVAEVVVVALDDIDGGLVLSGSGDLEVPRAGHSAARLCDDTVLITGGTDEAGAPGSERYSPIRTRRR